jgi:hypothetical protein
VFTLIEACASFEHETFRKTDPILLIMLQAAPVDYLDRGAKRCVTIVFTP